MELLRQISNFTSSIKDKIHIYKTCVRSVLEQSCVVWNSSITKKNEMELERVQKVAISIITKSTESYITKLKELNLETLKERRNILSARFAEKCSKNEKTKYMFKENTKLHNMKIRKKRKVQSVPC